MNRVRVGGEREGMGTVLQLVMGERKGREVRGRMRGWPVMCVMRE